MSRVKLTTNWKKIGKVPVWENNNKVRIHTTGLLYGKQNTHYKSVQRGRHSKPMYVHFCKLTGGNIRRSLMLTAELMIHNLLGEPYGS